MTDKTFSSKSNAVRDAKKALGADAAAGIAFTLSQAGDRWSWAAAKPAKAPKAAKPKADLDSLTDAPVEIVQAAPSGEYSPPYKGKGYDVPPDPARLPKYPFAPKAKAEPRVKPVDDFKRRVDAKVKAGSSRAVAEALVTKEDRDAGKHAKAAPARLKRTPPVAAPVEAESTSSRSNGKIDTLEAMVKRPEGASIEQIVEATGWQAHTARARITSSLRQRGVTCTSSKVDGVRVYKAAA